MEHITQPDIIDETDMRTLVSAKKIRVPTITIPANNWLSVPPRRPNDLSSRKLQFAQQSLFMTREPFIEQKSPENPPSQPSQSKCLNYGKEFSRQCMVLILKNHALELINLIVSTEHDDDARIVHKYTYMLINLLIVNGSVLEDEETSTNIIQNALHHIKDGYLTMCLHKMMRNIIQKKSYENIHFRVIKPHSSVSLRIPSEKRKYIESKLPQFRYVRQKFKTKTPPKFKVDQIVGARDKTNRWWLSRVLHVYNDSDSKFYWYYVHFEGWPKSSREWICSSTYSIRQFNPKKHILRRT